MKIFTHTLAALVTGMLLMTAAHASPLEELSGDYRPFVIFAPDPDNRLLRQQLNVVERNRQGFEKRDMAVLIVYPDGIKSVMGPHVDAAPEAVRDHLDAESYEFSAVLVGKDGAAKHRAVTPYSAPALFSIIDSMPMRQGEMGRDPVRY